MKQYLLERTTAWLTTWSLILLVAVAQKDVHPDVVAVVDVAGGVQPTPLWASSYSDGENCYCLPSLDSAFGNFVVETPLGWLTMQELCDLLGTGPGRLGQYLYNDIQCGNGPPNADENEFLCPGRTDLGPEGYGQIGPRWNFDVTKSLPPGSAPMALPSSLAAVAVLVPMLPGVGVITGLLFCVLNWHIFDLVRCHQGVW